MSPLSWRALLDARRLERSLLAAALVPGGLLILLSRWSQGGDWVLVLGLGAGYVLLFAALHAGLTLVQPGADPFVLPLAALLGGVSIAFLARLDADLAVWQLRWLSAGGVALLVLAGVNVMRVPPALVHAAAAVTFLVLVWTALYGVEAGGSRAWVGIGRFGVQPVEAARVVLVWCWAHWLLPPARLPAGLAWTAAMVAALLAQRELGYPLLLAAVAAVMIYVATGRRRVLVGALALGAVTAGIIQRLFPHLERRVIAWLDPWGDPYGAGYQPLQALFALAEGGLLGRGIGVGAPAIIPEVHTDFLLAAVGEELGFLGAAALVTAMALLVGRALVIARRLPAAPEGLLAAGIGLLVGLQSLWMVAALVRALPLSGVGLPLVSYGGSAALSNLAALGLLLRVSGGSALEPTPTGDGVSGRLGLVAKGAAAAFVVVVALMAYWQAVRADLRTHPYNPRPALQGQLEARGGILDRRGEPLAETRTRGGTPVRELVGPASLVHVVGYADTRFGLAGIEAAYHADLAGLVRDLAEWWRDPLRRRPRGRDVLLTIDNRVQSAAERALAGRRGAVVVLRPQTGEVLAMSSHPTFSPAELPRLLTGREEAAPLLNRATQGLYPPGSTFKVLTMAAALDAGLIASSEQLTALKQALAISSNTPFANLVLQLGARELAAAAGRAGFGARLIAEVPGAVSPLPTAATAGDLTQAGIGQGHLVATPLQMAVVAAAIANQGIAMKPHLVREVRAADGRTARMVRAESLGPPVFSPAAARAVTEAMVLAVEEGTARAAAVPGVRVAGKTGTAEAPNGDTHAWFIGFAPAFQPEVAVAVVIEGGGSGGRVAAPAGGAVLAAALDAVGLWAEVNP